MNRYFVLHLKVSVPTWKGALSGNSSMRRQVQGRGWALVLVDQALQKTNDQSFQCLSCGGIEAALQARGSHKRAIQSAKKFSSPGHRKSALLHCHREPEYPPLTQLNPGLHFFRAVTCAMSYQWVEISKYRLNETKLKNWLKTKFGERDFQMRV